MPLSIGPVEAWVLAVELDGYTLVLMENGQCGDSRTVVPRIFTQRRFAEAAVPYNRVHVVSQYAPIELQIVPVAIWKRTWLDNLFIRWTRPRKQR